MNPRRQIPANVSLSRGLADTWITSYNVILKFKQLAIPSKRARVYNYESVLTTTKDRNTHTERQDLLLALKSPFSVRFSVIIRLVDRRQRLYNGRAVSPGAVLPRSRPPRKQCAKPDGLEKFKTLCIRVPGPEN